MPRVRATDLVTWRHCRKKFEYKLARGWEVDNESRESVIGTAFHAGLAAAYPSNNIDAGVDAMLAYMASRPAFPAHEPIDQALIEDMLRYYWANKTLDIAEVIATEQEMEITLLCPMDTNQGPQMAPFSIVMHLDLVARDSQGQLLVVDHKTKTRMPGAYEWFQLSTQMKLYSVGAWREYGEVPKVIHNLVRQAVPPGFGHHDWVYNKDGSRSKRQASTAVNDYLRSHSFLKSEDALAFYEQDVRGMCKEIILAIMGAVRFERNDGILCERCPYLAACLREDMGERLTDAQAKLLFKVTEEEESETIDG